MGTAVFFFQFFAIQTVFYGGSSILSGLLNANRDYFWSTVAPVANNLIVIATFVLYAAVAPANPTLALYIIAIGNPLGVAAQMLIQMPALKRNGIRLRPRVNLRDPALRDTVALGAPTIVVMVCSFVTVSVMNAASYCFADDGPSVIAYARLWYALPYSLLAIPITTALFTELAHLHEDGDRAGFVRAVAGGTSQIMFLLIPFALYLVVFAFPLVTLYHFGAFTMDNVSQIAAFLAGLAAALPLYGVSSYLQKVFSSMRKMGVFRLRQRGCQRGAGGPHHAGRVRLPAGRAPSHRKHRLGVGCVLPRDRRGVVRLLEAPLRARGHRVHPCAPVCWARFWAGRGRLRAGACCRGFRSHSAGSTGPSRRRSPTWSRAARSAWR